MKKGHLLIGAEKIPVVSEYPYLGVTISATGKFVSLFVSFGRFK